MAINRHSQPLQVSLTSMEPHIDAKCRLQPYLNSQNYVNYGSTASQSMRHDVKHVSENNKWLQHLFAELRQGLRLSPSPVSPTVQLRFRSPRNLK